MEIVLHFNYIGAISKAKPDWASYSAAQLSLLAFLNLHIIWLKLLLPWRLFRLWALIDGIDPPENMIRCVNNNYSTQMFWRSWHRSYNRWLIRYIYAPLGGASFRTWQSSAQSAVTYLLVFTFVALWHDIKLRLLIWGWLIVFFMMPEWTAIYLFPKKNWERHPTFYRNICAVGALGNILMMVSANLIGFAVGVDGMQAIGSGIVQEWSGKFIGELLAPRYPVLTVTCRSSVSVDCSRGILRGCPGHVRSTGGRETKGYCSQMLVSMRSLDIMHRRPARSSASSSSTLRSCPLSHSPLTSP